MALIGHDGHTLAAMTVAFGKLPQWAQIGSIVVALLSVGATGALLFADFVNLGPRVALLEESAATNDSLHNNLDVRLRWIESDARTDRVRIESKIDRVICLQEAQAGQHDFAQCAR